jgi:hypothetical protein
MIMHGVMKRLILITAGLWLGFPAYAGAECLDEHLRGAIALNQLRAPQYAALSSGRSREVSERLVEAERKSLLPARLALWSTRSWREKGVPVLCSEFESMVRVPPPIERAVDERPRLEDRMEPAWSELVTDLELMLSWRLAANEGAEIAWRALEGRLAFELELIAPEPRFNCMYRHVVESMIRTARAAPELVRLSSEHKMRSPEKWSIRLFKRHFDALEFALELDRLAAPIQADGIPMICNDVPPL